MRRLVLVAALAALLGGCQPSPPKPAPGSAARPKVALVMKSLANDFFATMAKGAREHQAAHAADYELLVLGIKNETDLAEQVNLVEQAVAQGAAAIVIAPADSKALVPALRRAQQQGVVIVNIDNRLDADAARAAGLSAAFVGPDNRDGARRVGLALAARLHPGDEVAIIEGVTTAFNGQQRRAGFEDAMQSAGMKVVAVQSGEWEMDKANGVAANLLTAHPGLKALLCANDNMAIGAAAAVAAAGKTGAVQVAGFDAIAAIRPLLADGRVAATADQHADQLAVFGIEQALATLRDGHPAGDRATAVDVVTR
ncbi:MAG: substrate-binding domain-containing protein [Proteobacteria bacterium]|nr:substrate-binding domain-containing protein [Pseudomonadota bacterium]